MQKLVWINSKGTEINLTSGDYGITEWEGFSACDLEVQTQNVPFQDGSVFLDALLNNRELSVTLAINDGKDLEKRYRLRRELISALNPKLGEGYLIYTNDFISKRIKCLAQMPVFPTHNSDKAGTPKASLSWTACDPYWEDVEETSKCFSDIEQPVISNNGDVKAQLKINIYSENVKNIKLENLNDNNYIYYKEVINDGLEINTNIGKKEVLQQKYKVNYIISGQPYRSILAKDDYIYITSNNGTILRTKDFQVYDILSTGTIENLNKITYIDFINKYFCVGDNGIILSSEDGENWTIINISGIDYKFTKIVNNDNFILIYGNSHILKSTDGITFQDIPLGFSLSDITYSEDLDLFVGIGSFIYNSIDGELWESVYDISSISYRASIAYSKEKHLFAGIKGYVSIYSSDGINWNIKNQSLNPSFSFDYFENEIYSSKIKGFIGIAQNTIAVSYNGIDWKTVYSSNVYLNDICYFDKYGYFFVSGSAEIIKSSDGEKWENYIKGNTGRFYNARYLNKKVFLVGDLDAVSYARDGRVLINSDDTLRIFNTIFTTSRGLCDIAYSEKLKLYCAVGGQIEQHARIFVSSDLQNWTETYNDGIRDLVNIIYCDTLKIFIVSDTYGNMISSDGYTWQFISNSCRPKKTIFSKYLNVLLSVGSAGASRSINGSYWDRIITDNFYNAITSAEVMKKICLVGNNGVIAIGTELTTIKEVDSGVQTDLQAVDFSEYLGLFCAVGFNGTVLVSYNGENWVKIQMGNYNFYSVTHTEKEFVLTGREGILVKIDFENSVNKIQNIAEGSNMNLGLEQGNNQFRVYTEEGSAIIKLTYRQKYIGV